MLIESVDAYVFIFTQTGIAVWHSIYAEQQGLIGKFMDVHLF